MSPYLWVTFLSILSLVSSVSFRIDPDQTTPPLSTGIPALQFALNVSAPLPWIIGGSVQSIPPLDSRMNVTASSGETVNYECDNHLSSLLSAECREAWRQIPRFDEKMYSIGNRSADQRWDIPLPMRWPSNKGTCNIEVDQFNEGSVMSDYASGPEMSNAARFLINRCAERTGRGGTAKPLGQGSHLALSIKAYKPDLRCHNPDAPVKRLGPMGPVQSILNQMKVSKWEEVFGKAGSPKIQIPLPLTIPDTSSKYFVTVSIHGPPVTARWYDLWTDAVAVTGVCVQNDKWGISTRQFSGSQGITKITVAVHNETANAALTLDPNLGD